MKILCFDPGGSTGFAKWVDGTITSGQFEVTEGEHQVKLWRFLVQELSDIIVYEDFEYRSQADADLMAKEYIGIFKLYRGLRNGPGLSDCCQQTVGDGKVTLAKQVPAQGVGKKAFWTNDKLEKLDLLTRPLKPNRHANDAKRHLLYYITFTLNDQTYLQGLK